MKPGKLFVLLAISGFMPAHASFEYDVQCLSAGTLTPGPHFPTYQAWQIGQDTKSRYVEMFVQWNSSTGILATDAVSGGAGMEFKSYQYNYDDASSTGKGPAYVTAPSGYFYCNLPGCYLDTDFLSQQNSVGEYNEPQVAFGITPGAGKSLKIGVMYGAATRAIAGRGNTSLLKARNHVTKTVVSALGKSGIFLCRDVVPLTLISMKQGVYSPTCIWRRSDGAYAPCKSGGGIPW